jgi:hypothetical protein
LAIRFDNSADFFTRTASAPSQATLTAMAWVYQISRPSGLGNWFSIAGAADTDYIIAGILTSGGLNYTESNNSGSDVSDTGSALSLATWYHLAIVRSGGNLVGYLNGVADTTQSAAAFTSTRFWLGNSQFTTNNLDGRIGGCLIYEAALTDAEIQQQMRQYAPVRTANLWAWYPMADNSVAGCAVDYSGNGRNLTTNGTLTLEDGPPVAWKQGARRIFIPAAVAGGSVALDGVIAGRASSQGALSIVRALNGRAQGQGRIASVASALRPLASNVASRARANGAASITRNLTGTVTGRSSTQGAAGALRSLASAVASRSNAIGNVGTAAVMALTGWIAGRSSVQGALSIVRNLSGRADGRTRTNGTASIVRNLTARVAGRSTAQSAAGALRVLSSVVRAGATVRASFPPLVTEVVGIVRALLRGSMKTAPIAAIGKIRNPVVISANNMIAKNVRLKDYVIGDDTEIAFELTDWPAGVVLAKAYFTVKRSLDDADAAAIIQREITAVLSVEGQITANGSSGTATGYFLIRHQDSEWAEIKPISPYHFDIQPITDQSTVQTPIIGTISFQKGATDAAS